MLNNLFHRGNAAAADGASFADRTKKLAEDFCAAARAGDMRAVEGFVRWNGFDINSRTGDGETAFIAACDAGKTEVVRRLLVDPRIDLNAQDEKDRTAFFAACAGNHIDLVQLLLMHQDRIDVFRAAKAAGGLFKKKPQDVGNAATKKVVADGIKRKDELLQLRRANEEEIRRRWEASMAAAQQEQQAQQAATAVSNQVRPSPPGAFPPMPEPASPVSPSPAPSNEVFSSSPVGEEGGEMPMVHNVKPRVASLAASKRQSAASSPHSSLGTAVSPEPNNSASSALAAPNKQETEQISATPEPAPALVPVKQAEPQRRTLAPPPPPSTVSAPRQPPKIDEGEQQRLKELARLEDELRLWKDLLDVQRALIKERGTILREAKERKAAAVARALQTPSPVAPSPKLESGQLSNVSIKSTDSGNNEATSSPKIEPAPAASLSPATREPSHLGVPSSDSETSTNPAPTAAFDPGVQMAFQVPLVAVAAAARPPPPPPATKSADIVVPIMSIEGDGEDSSEASLTEPMIFTDGLSRVAPTASGTVGRSLFSRPPLVTEEIESVHRNSTESSAAQQSLVPESASKLEAPKTLDVPVEAPAVVPAAAAAAQPISIRPEELPSSTPVRVPIPDSRVAVTEIIASASEPDALLESEVQDEQPTKASSQEASITGLETEISDADLALVSKPAPQTEEKVMPVSEMLLTQTPVIPPPRHRVGRAVDSPNGDRSASPLLPVPVEDVEEKIDAAIVENSAPLPPPPIVDESVTDSQVGPTIPELPSVAMRQVAKEAGILDVSEQDLAEEEIEGEESVVHDVEGLVGETGQTEVTNGVKTELPARPNAPEPPASQPVVASVAPEEPPSLPPVELVVPEAKSPNEAPPLPADFPVFNRPVPPAGAAAPAPIQASPVPADFPVFNRPKPAGNGLQPPSIPSRPNLEEDIGATVAAPIVVAVIPPTIEQDDAGPKKVEATEVEVDRGTTFLKGPLFEVFHGQFRGATVAVTSIPDRSSSARGKKRFEEEASFFASLPRHNKVFPILAYTTEPNYVITALPTHGTLREYLVDDKLKDPIAAIVLLADIASGMEFLHSKGFLHCDLHADSVVMDASAGGPPVARIGFGAAKVRTMPEDGKKEITLKPRGREGFRMNSAAPEFFDGESIKAPNDVWAFGMLCFTVFSGGSDPFSDRLTNVDVSGAQ